jgi:hypothetical protein
MYDDKDFYLEHYRIFLKHNNDFEHIYELYWEKIFQTLYGFVNDYKHGARLQQEIVYNRLGKAR